MATFPWLLASLALLLFGGLALWVIWPLRARAADRGASPIPDTPERAGAVPADASDPGPPRPDTRSR